MDIVSRYILGTLYWIAVSGAFAALYYQSETTALASIALALCSFPRRIS